MDAELRCGGCGTDMKPLPRRVEVVESHHVVTTYTEGSPSGGHDVPVFAGVFCSRACAVAELTKETNDGD